MDFEMLKLPLVRQVNAKSYFDDLEVTQPLVEEIASFFKTTHTSEIQEPIYHPIVTEDNIEYVKAQFETDDVQIGDTVHTWDSGGWDALAGRAGLQLKRNGKDMRFILTRIS
jgi:hypothetical protein